MGVAEPVGEKRAPRRHLGADNVAIEFVRALPAETWTTQWSSLTGRDIGSLRERGPANAIAGTSAPAVNEPRNLNLPGGFTHRRCSDGQRGVPFASRDRLTP